ncbi:Uncharacterized protein HZ326_29868, partial [Fusarium oxysporum f. sp. albedinis]
MNGQFRPECVEVCSRTSTIILNLYTLLTLDALKQNGASCPWHKIQMHISLHVDRRTCRSSIDRHTTIVNLFRDNS